MFDYLILRESLYLDVIFTLLYAKDLYCKQTDTSLLLLLLLTYLLTHSLT